jgi:putative component of toxin-antitoxin plasmid stabilization module
MPEVQPKEIQRYTTPDNRVPFEEWFNFLRDGKAKARIRLRLDRVQLGNLGDYRFVG